MPTVAAVAPDTFEGKDGSSHDQRGKTDWRMKCKSSNYKIEFKGKICTAITYPMETVN